MLWVAHILLLLAASPIEALSCLEKISEKAPPDWKAQLKSQHSRALPSSKVPWSSSDWPSNRKATWAGQTSELEPPPDTLCARPTPSGPDPWTLRLKVWHGVVWARGDDFTRPWVDWRHTVLQQLLAAIWLFKDFPKELDLFVCTRDTPCTCEGASLPWLQFSVLNLTSPLPSQPFGSIHPNHLLDFIDTTQPQLSSTLPYTQGFAIPDPDTWHQLSLSPEQLKGYSQCLAERLRKARARRNEQVNAVGQVVRDQQEPGSRRSLQEPGSAAPQAAAEGVVAHEEWVGGRIPRVIWRGSTSGATRGWEHKVATSPRNNLNAAGKLLMNKRVYLSHISLKHPWLDVGLTTMNDMGSELWGEHEGGPWFTALQREEVDMEDWSRYVASLSVDGFGPPWRLARQGLGLGPVVKVVSPLREFWSHHWLPGVHYMPVAYDLRDVLNTTHAIITEARANSTRLQAMAAAARSVLINQVNGLAQLDALVWAVLQVQRACTWRVQDPSPNTSAASLSHGQQNNNTRDGTSRTSADVVSSGAEPGADSNQHGRGSSTAGWSIVRLRELKSGLDWPPGMRAVRDALVAAGHPNMA